MTLATPTPTDQRVLPWQYDDGGREAAGFKGTTRDCVVRSIAIVADLPYQLVYHELSEAQKAWAQTSRGRAAKRICETGRWSVRHGVQKKVYKSWLIEHGFNWTPTMGIGTGCQVHLTTDELPNEGRYVVSVSRHLTTLVDGVILDTHDPSRDGTRCVYGLWRLGPVVDSIDSGS